MDPTGLLFLLPFIVLGVRGGFAVLPDTGVTAGTYSPLGGTVDAKGRLTSASVATAGQILTTRSPAFGSALGEGSNVGTTIYLPCVGGAGPKQANVNSSAGRFLKAVTVTKVRIYLSANTALAASTFTLFKAGIATAITGSIAAETTGLFEATGSVVWTAGQTVVIELIIGAGGTTITVDAVEVEFS